MTDILQPSTSERGDKMKSNNKPQGRIRDEVFWNELEIRRLSNFVAEGINSQRYTGNSLGAMEERQQLHVYIDAMKRKSLRILHRAEKYVKNEQYLGSWPGIDKSIVDPVSLADEYIQLVENYDNIILNEEEKIQNERKSSKEDWEVDDDVAFQKAKQEQQQNDEQAPTEEKEEDEKSKNERNELLSGIEERKDIDENEGIRKRHLVVNNNNEDVEKLMKSHQPIQDELTSKLVHMVGQLKESVTENQNHLDKDKKVLEETENVVDKNVAALQNQRKNLSDFSQSASTSWWKMLLLAILIICIFLFIVLIILIPM